MPMSWGQPVRLAAAIAACLCLPVPAIAAGDLLVAPTRVLLDGARGTEVILNNIGSEPATYRISLELRRMPVQGPLAEVAAEQADARESAALAMISYAPRRVTLPPNQPQSVRIGIRPPADLPDGEYRAHMLFRAIPDAKPVVADPSRPANGVSISLTPIYGVTIPVIVRKGSLTATAALSDPRIVRDDDGQAFAITIARSGTRSVYGRIRVTRPGVAAPLLEARGIAVYAEVPSRTVTLPVDDETATRLKGPVKVEYLEDQDAGGGLIAALDGAIR